MDRQQRAMLVVPYAPPPPPRRHLVGSVVSAGAGTVALLGLLIADYSAATVAGLAATATVGFVLAAALLARGITVRRRFRREMERAKRPVPLQPLESESREAV